MKTILSLFDYTGNWSKPYRDSGYNVIQIDIKNGIDILTWNYKDIEDVYGVLCAMPCTDYAVSGARWFADKDIDGRTEKSQLLVAKCKEIIEYFNPVFWVLENPVSRIHNLNNWLGKPKFYFHPYEFAHLIENAIDEQYSKKTALYGKFNNPIKGNLPCLDTTKIHKPKTKDGKSPGFHTELCKELRQETPHGFSKAFYEVNL